MCSTPECPNGGNCYDAGLKLILQSTLLHTTHFVLTYLCFAEHNKLQNLHCTLYYTLRTAQWSCTLNTAHWAIYPGQQWLVTLRSRECLKWTLHCTLQTAHFTVHCRLHTSLHTADCTLHCTLHTAHFTAHCTLHTALHTAHSTLSTRYNTLYNKSHCTLHTLH